MPSLSNLRFLIDENVRKEVADFLRLCGHDVLILGSGIKDEETARIAKETKRIILTHDQHFADILMYPPEEYPGIIRIKIHPPSAPAIINALKDFLSKIGPDRLGKKLIILEEDGFRVR
jgi:predicted nuclease of predicted toxin-antitoxin system